MRAVQDTSGAWGGLHRDCREKSTPKVATQVMKNEIPEDGLTVKLDDLKYFGASPRRNHCQLRFLWYGKRLNSAISILPTWERP